MKNENFEKDFMALIRACQNVGLKKIEVNEYCLDENYDFNYDLQEWFSKNFSVGGRCIEVPFEKSGFKRSIEFMGIEFLFKDVDDITVISPSQTI